MTHGFIYGSVPVPFTEIMIFTPPCFMIGVIFVRDVLIALSPPNTVTGLYTKKFSTAFLWPQDILQCLIWIIQRIICDLKTVLDIYFSRGVLQDFNPWQCSVLVRATFETICLKVIDQILRCSILSFFHNCANRACFLSELFADCPVAPMTISWGSIVHASLM